MVLSFISALNTTSGSCPWQKQTIPCDFDLYSSNQTLTTEQKLLPNTDITGTSVLIMFAVSGFFACVLSILLLVDELLLIARRWPAKAYSHVYCRKLILGIDTTLHNLSDFSVAAGLALLITAELHSNCISAYHLNVICYLMIMSLITHVLTFVNVPEFCSKNMWLGVGRIVGIVATLILTWTLFRERDIIADFPISPSPRLIMPAACFVGNQTFDILSSAVGSVSMGTNGSTNVTAVFDSLISAASTGEGGSQYKSLFLPVALFMIIGLVFLIVDSCRGLRKQTDELHWSDWQHKCVWGLRCVITIALFCLAISATSNYFTLRNGFEVEAWYVSSDEDTASLGQIVTILMSTSTILAALKIIGEEIGFVGPRGEKVVEALCKAYTKYEEVQGDVEKGKQCYIVTQNNLSNYESS